MAAVSAAPRGVERPRERHALDVVERRTAAHFLVAGLVGATLGFGKRGGAAALYSFSDITGRRRMMTEVKKEGQRCHGGDIPGETRLFRRLFATSWPPPGALSSSATADYCGRVVGVRRDRRTTCVRDLTTPVRRWRTTRRRTVAVEVAERDVVTWRAR
jgi:hypothetical protein